MSDLSNSKKIGSLLKPSLNWLLIFLPITIIMELIHFENHTIIFIFSCLSILPLAGWLGKATEHIAEKTSEGIGGLLNATFGNAAELIIALLAMQKGLHGVVKASITGSIIGNLLLVSGAAFIAGGFKFKVQKFNKLASRSQATMLLLASIALIMPAVFHYVGGSSIAKENGISLEISIVLIISYALSLWFNLHTHKKLFSNSEEAIETDKKHQEWSLTKSIVILIVATGLIAWVSEILVGSIEVAAKSFGMTSIFVGVIVVAIVGNAAEHSTAIMVAMKNRMDLSLSIAVGSSVQIALFVAPVLVFASYFIGPNPLNLVFSPAEIIAITLSVIISSQISGDGESNWLEGVQLLAVYIIFAIIFYYLPENTIVIK
ncbi:MAG: calcium/proton exchanger [Candidatus Sericytochromatia bacterium]|nr:calcium/proton exchanger [Candidatus Sericytochromatia bacterium]